MVPYFPLDCLLFTLLLSTYFPVANANPGRTDQPEVTTRQGTVSGITTMTWRGRSVSAFMGIPYAKPPIGNLRFASPVPADGWSGTLNATDDSIMCAQRLRDGVKGEEDCLYLNVYTPQLPGDKNSSLLPVMAYIHGGGFVLGSKSSSIFGPAYLLDKDVVLVIPNYRLGALGFLSTGDEVASGNWGLKDQVLALKWVQDNIGYFGGDPDRVTIFGESVGASSVSLLSLSNATIGLFHRIITQSGSAYSGWGFQPRAAYSTRAFDVGRYVGCPTYSSIALIDCLRTVDASSMIAVDSKISATGLLVEVLWSPTDEPDVEGAIRTDTPSNILASGKVRDLPCITGVVRDEGILATRVFYENANELNKLLKNFDATMPYLLAFMFEPDVGAYEISMLKSYYLNNDLTKNRNLLLSNLTDLFGDTLVNYPAYKELKQRQALANNPQYFYSFNFQAPYSSCTFFSGSIGVYGVDHSSELIYLFSSDSYFPNLTRLFGDGDLKIVDAMVELWTSFAINGTPTYSGTNDTVKWEPYSAEKDNYLRIGNNFDVALETEHSFFKERMEFWARLDADKQRLEVDNRRDMTRDYFGRCRKTPEQKLRACPCRNRH